MHFHWYTDDTQLYLLKPDNTLQLVKLKENLMHIKFQMTSNFLLLNSEKKRVYCLCYTPIGLVCWGFPNDTMFLLYLPLFTSHS